MTIPTSFMYPTRSLAHHGKLGVKDELKASDIYYK